jgi:hypothetical protein
MCMHVLEKTERNYDTFNVTALIVVSRISQRRLTVPIITHFEHFVVFRGHKQVIILINLNLEEQS